MSDFLDSPFSASDVKKALFDMFPTKANGPNGMLALFCQRFWVMVGDSMTAACLRTLNDGDPLETVNDTLITLISKAAHPTRMSEFRPISLCNMMYKIVVKTLANRFRLALGDLISEAQSAFVPGRLITDNAVIGFECIHVIRNKKCKKGSMALKLDMSKAYDMVEWNFLASMIIKLGFSVG
ncbi:hypothetical protein LWI28_006417 [Acer negundo]|uniref:Reverse transcriptase domain-containing protein n=1 Tax=Acer negundo TaxID=4023 RepID=A0AAD5NMV9_ACENE|nr:hypothetical protein LWI28_006417 [Acer negundo]